MAFFAKISASISHEIKNHLAIINELNGLMGDVLSMADQGKAVPVDKFAEVIRDVARQISLADATVRRFNTFAHTADSSTLSIDVAEMLDLLVELSRRPARLKEMTLGLETCPENVRIQTHPFEFLHVLSACLRLLLESGVAGQAISLGLEVDTTRARVVMTVRGADTPSQNPCMARAPSPDPGLALLLQRLHADLQFQPEQGRLLVSFPLDVGQEDETDA